MAELFLNQYKGIFEDNRVEHVITGTIAEAGLSLAVNGDEPILLQKVQKGIRTTLPVSFTTERNIEEGGITAPPAFTVNNNERVILTAIASPLYQFDNWTDSEGEIVSEDAVAVVSINSSLYTANFSLIPVLITFTAEVNIEEGGTAEPVTLTLGEGEEATLTAIASPLYQFGNWTDSEGTIVSTEAIATIPIYSNSYTANFSLKE